ncbi:hypothetical protein ALC57_16455 [Trachymyrmex cornetzi]|uniref:Gustatory receptor n=1 Tax=Trachymyrmex cornetzi TaxID=471704 RepID=A0A151IV31_9HYME|nr:hypothetical protein ALC57_16455 [Trachymyrmex cornetzi]
MTKTLERALAPLMTIGGFCNLCMFEYPLGKPRTYISYLYALTKWSLLVYFNYYPEFIISLKIYKMIFTSDIILLITFILILISICHFKELKMCLRELAIVDHTLEALGEPKEYQRRRNWIIRITIGWIAYVLFQSAFYIIINLFIVNFDTYKRIFFFSIFFAFQYTYPSNIIILSALISAAILGLVLYMCIHLLCKLFLLTLCIKMFIVKPIQTLCIKMFIVKPIQTFC